METWKPRLRLHPVPTVLSSSNLTENGYYGLLRGPGPVRLERDSGRFQSAGRSRDAGSRSTYYRPPWHRLVGAAAAVETRKQTKKALGKRGKTHHSETDYRVLILFVRILILISISIDNFILLTLFPQIRLTSADEHSPGRIQTTRTSQDGVDTQPEAGPSVPRLLYDPCADCLLYVYACLLHFLIFPPSLLVWVCLGSQWLSPALIEVRRDETAIMDRHMSNVTK